MKYSFKIGGGGMERRPLQLVYPLRVLCYCTKLGQLHLLNRGSFVLAKGTHLCVLQQWFSNYGSRPTSE